MGACIPLAKAYDPSKIEFPGYLSVKLDGVPVRIDVETAGQSVRSMTLQSRQGEHLQSVTTQATMLAARSALSFPAGRYTFVAEVTHRTLSDFKDVSGVVRRHEQSNDLILNIFDFDLDFPAKTSFGNRYQHIRRMHNSLCCEHIKIVHQAPVSCQVVLDLAVSDMRSLFPDAEGFVYRAASAEFKPGARHWDYMKIVEDPSVDLMIVGFEEGKGKNAGAAGTLIAEYKGTRIGIGPGKLSYSDRFQLWKQWGYRLNSMEPRLAKIKYKRDSSYTALRQPTFQCWRDDKDEVSYD